MIETTKDLWLGDGTFKQCLDMFYQKYTIHIRIGGYSPSCLYALLPNKTERTYIDFNQALLQLVPNANTEKIMMDFEKVAVQAFLTTFPLAHFHLCQSVLRKIIEVGLKETLYNNPGIGVILEGGTCNCFLYKWCRLEKVSI